MELYRDADRIDSSARARLKAMALEFLDAYQRQGDRDALIGLIDALLSVDYDDIDVLLFLARHQHDADYFQEAAQIGRASCREGVWVAVGGGRCVRSVMRVAVAG